VCSRIVRKECVDRRVQLEIAFVLIFLEGAVGHRGSVQGVRRLGKSLRVANLSKELKDCCCRSAQSRETSTLS
jgi:hypothetical protein